MTLKVDQCRARKLSREDASPEELIKRIEQVITDLPYTVHFLFVTPYFLYSIIELFSIIIYILDLVCVVHINIYSFTHFIV